MVSAHAFGQAADAVTFDVSVLRVDLVASTDGEPTERFVEVTEAVPGEVVEYRIVVRNEGEIIFRPGTVVVTLPFGDGVAYQEDTATSLPGQIFLEFSADGGATFMEPPVLVGTGESRTVAEVAAYDHVRWTVMGPFAPGEEWTLVYRVDVR